MKPISAVSFPNITINVDMFNSNSSLNIEELKCFTSKSDAYVRSALAICKLLSIIDEDGNVNSFVNSLGRTPNDELKLNVMRKFIIGLKEKITTF